MVKCLSHDDGSASVHVSPGTDQPVAIMCHARCETVDVVEAAGMTWADVCRPLEETSAEVSEWTPKGTASHVYNYFDEDGTLLYQTLRVPLANGAKTFFQRTPTGDERKPWRWNLEGVRRVLFRLPAIIRAKDAGRDIWLFEGEKDAEAAAYDGLDATCNPMGAGKWIDGYSETLRGSRVTICVDNDEVGRQHGRDIAEELVKVDCLVRIVETSMEGCKDYYDHRARGGTWDTLTETYRSAEVKDSRPEYGFRTFIRTEFDGGREIIPGYLAEANVVLLVGEEGFGKSLLMRQTAVQCAAGINPFTGAAMTPLRVVYIDAENPEHQQKIDWVKLDHLATRHNNGREMSDDNLTIISAWQDPPDLITPGGQAWLMERITGYKPQLLLMGPISDLVVGKLADDDVARKFKRAIYKGRSICGTAFMIEHHSPHRMQGDKQREMRPYGSSVFRRFPDFGYGIQPRLGEDEAGQFDLVPFRGARVRSRAWPEMLRWGTPNSLEWPWEFTSDVRGSVTVGNFGAGA